MTGSKAETVFRRVCISWCFGRDCCVGWDIIFLGCVFNSFSSAISWRGAIVFLLCVAFWGGSARDDDVRARVVSITWADQKYRKGVIDGDKCQRRVA